MLDCLTSIVGISKSECDCLITGLTSDQIAAMKVSTSGLYMDELEGAVDFKGLANVDDCKDMYILATEARDLAIKRFEDDLVTALNSKYQKDKKNFSGQLGRMSYAQSLAVAQPWQGINIKPLDYGDTVITIKRIQLVINQTISLTIKLFRAPINTVVAEEIGSFPVNAVANVYSTATLNAPLKLPAVVNGQMVEYYLAYDLTGLTAQPKDTTVVCLPCQGGISGYGDFITATGVQFASPSNLSIKNTDNYSHGFILDVDIKCDNDKLFCRAYNENEAIAVVFAYCVLYKANEILNEKILAPGMNINRFTMGSREQMYGKRNHFKKEYETRFPYLLQVINPISDGCYVCRETENQPSMHHILI